MFAALLARGITPDVVTCSALMHVYAQAGSDGAADKLLAAMQSWGVKPNEHTYLAVVKAYAKAKRWSQALQLLQDLQRGGRVKVNAYHVSALLSGVAEQGTPGMAEAVLASLGIVTPEEAQQLCCAPADLTALTEASIDAAPGPATASAADDEAQARSSTAARSNAADLAARQVSHSQASTSAAAAPSASRQRPSAHASARTSAFARSQSAPSALSLSCVLAAVGATRVKRRMACCAVQQVVDRRQVHQPHEQSEQRQSQVWGQPHAPQQHEQHENLRLQAWQQSPSQHKRSGQWQRQQHIGQQQRQQQGSQHRQSSAMQDMQRISPPLSPPIGPDDGQQLKHQFLGPLQSPVSGNDGRARRDILADAMRFLAKGSDTHGDELPLAAIAAMDIPAPVLRPDPVGAATRATQSAPPTQARPPVQAQPPVAEAALPTASQAAPPTASKAAEPPVALPDKQGGVRWCEWVQPMKWWPKPSRQAKATPPRDATAAAPAAPASQSAPAWQQSAQQRLPEATQPAQSREAQSPQPQAKLQEPPSALSGQVHERNTSGTASRASDQIAKAADLQFASDLQLAAQLDAAWETQTQAQHLPGVPDAWAIDGPAASPSRPAIAAPAQVQSPEAAPAASHGASPARSRLPAQPLQSSASEVAHHVFDFTRSAEWSAHRSASGHSDANAAAQMAARVKSHAIVTGLGHAQQGAESKRQREANKQRSSNARPDLPKADWLQAAWCPCLPDDDRVDAASSDQTTKVPFPHMQLDSDIIPEREAAQLVSDLTLSVPTSTTIGRKWPRGDHKLVNAPVFGALSKAYMIQAMWRECTACIGRARAHRLGDAPHMPLYNMAMWAAAQRGQVHVLRVLLRYVPMPLRRQGYECLTWCHAFRADPRAAERTLAEAVELEVPISDYAIVALILSYSNAGQPQHAVQVRHRVAEFGDVHELATQHVLNMLMTVCVKHRMYARGVQIVSSFQVYQQHQRSAVTQLLMDTLYSRSITSIEQQHAVASALSAAAAAAGGALIRSGLF